MPSIPTVSVFNAGYINKSTNRSVLQREPYATATVADIWNYIRGPRAKRATEALRAETDEEKQREMKKLSLKYCTPSGVFSCRNEKGLTVPSGMMVIDIDHIDSPDALAALRRQLIGDPHYTTDLLFTSPRGHGLKWFVHVGELGGMKHADCFRRISRYMQFEYGILIDESGKDIPRACFLSHDPDCYINPKYISI